MSHTTQVRVLLALTYYRPHVSGLTIYVERLARALARRGHTATILTMQYDRRLPLEEERDGVRVLRMPIIARVSKGVLAPMLGRTASRLAREHDVVSIHLPQFDAPGLTIRAHRENRPAILTYHCDLQLPPGLFNPLIGRVVFGANLVAAKLADNIVAYTQDYADHSPLLSRFRSKTVIIPPPVVMPRPSPRAVAAFKAQHVGDMGPIVGFAARFAAEKGVEYLVQAMPRLLNTFPKLRVLFAGQYLDVLGEDQYWRRLEPGIRALGEHWEFLGTLGPEQMPAFFAACGVLVVPSLNSTESFGLVQVEAMLCGTPTVASNLPGVRQPISMTGMGKVVPVADAAALAEGIEHVLNNRARYRRPRKEIEATFDVEKTVDAYVQLFEQAIRHRS
jgi:glycosyltransferase involved in cell wall biosynthesis